MYFILKWIHSLVAKGMKYLKAATTLSKWKGWLLAPHPEKEKNLPTNSSANPLNHFIGSWCIPKQSLWTGKWCHGLSLSCLNQSMRLTGMIGFHPWYSTPEASEIILPLHLQCYMSIEGRRCEMNWPRNKSSYYVTPSSSSRNSSCIRLDMCTSKCVQGDLHGRQLQRNEMLGTC